MDASKETAEQINGSFKLIAGGLLKVLFQTSQVLVPPVTGAVTDGATIGATTIVGTMAGGPFGGVVGAAAGTVILGVSKCLGNGNYKSVAKAIEEDLTEEQKNGLYEKVGKLLNLDVGTGTNYSVNQLTDSAVMDYKRTIEKNPEAMKSITNMVNETLAKKKIYFD